jgi:hypothetical protein
MEKKKRIRLKVASPCNANWDAMTGDEAIRFCGLCKKNVYQISNMTNDQVEELLADAGEKKCGRFYQRKDGTLVTADCSVGLKRKRRKQAVIGASAGFLSVLGVALSSVGGAPPAASNLPEQTTHVDPEPESHPPTDWDRDMIMGEMIQMPDVEEIEELEEAIEEPQPHRVRMGKISIHRDIDLDD